MHKNAFMVVALNMTAFYRLVCVDLYIGAESTPSAWTAGPSGGGVGQWAGATETRKTAWRQDEAADQTDQVIPCTFII